MLLEIEKELKKRKWGAAVRLEIKSQDFDQHVLDYLLDELEIHYKDVYEIEGAVDLTLFFSFTKKLSLLREGLTYETFIPQLPEDLSSREDVFEKTLQQDILFTIRTSRLNRSSILFHRQQTTHQHWRLK